jgi:hypothetical protein
MKRALWAVFAVVALACGGNTQGGNDLTLSGEIAVRQDLLDGGTLDPDEIPEPESDVYQLPADLPETLTLVWSNLGDMDIVSIQKVIVLELASDTRLPQNDKEEAWYNDNFSVRVVEVDKETGDDKVELAMDVTWRPVVAGIHRWPAMVLEPVRCDLSQDLCGEGAGDGSYRPTRLYKVTVGLGGDQVYSRLFHTMPGWSSGYEVVDFVVPAEECERCFPYPVHVNVFVPPEYYSDNPELDTTTTPWDNSKQRYSALVGLHTYNAEGMKLADTFGWATLPRFSSQGVLEPILLVLPDGTVPEPYCKGGWAWPVNPGDKTCYTQFMGIPNSELLPDFNAYTSYAYFLSHTMRKAVAQKFRIRGMDDAGNKLDNAGNIIDEEHPDDNAGRDHYRRAWGVTGCSGGGFGTPINTFLFAKDWGSMFALIGASPSMFNPYAYWNWTPEETPITFDQVCNKETIANYPYQPVGDGYRDLAMIDPASMVACPAGKLCQRPQGYCRPVSECTANCDEGLCPSTGETRNVTIDQRHVPAGAKSCFWMSPPAIPNEIVQGVLCGLDTTCRADPDAPDVWRTDFDKYPFDGNLMFTTGTLDFEGPPVGFMDLDQQLDKRGVVHSFRYEDRGAIYHDWNAVHDYVVGYAEIERKDGTVVPGNFPLTGLLYPFMNAAFEGLGNYPFNHPYASGFTTGAMDPDRDYVIDLVYPDNPSYNMVQDNCPGVPNHDQLDSDGDGIGDACDAD